MKSKTLIAGLTAVVVVTGLSLSSVDAYEGRGSFRKPGAGCDSDGGFAQKFMKKAHFVMEHADELGLDKAKVEAVRNLKMETKKSKIRQDAEIEIVDVEIKTKMYADPIDVEAVNLLIDQQYELKKSQAKSMVEALAKLKGMLTPEQIENMRKLWKAGEKREWDERGKSR